MKSSANIKSVVPVIAVPLIGLILLSITFLLSFVVHSFISRIFAAAGFNATADWYPLLRHLILLIVACLLSLLVFRSQLGEMYKAIFFVVPTAIAIITVNRFLLQLVLACAVGAVIYGAILLYLFLTKRSWLYYYAVTLVTIALLIANLLGMDI